MKLTACIANFFSSMLNPPTLAEVSAIEAEKAALEIMQCDHVIKTHKFQRHMALKKIEALDEWNRFETEGYKHGN